ncbi:MAG TPA: electron transfer flavoprotein subunit beta [Candidatus Sumerlaeota bacterium]|nr:electron transfer flavoprotein subunit beta [Candidatus Sumerlaeota bacterium]
MSGYHVVVCGSVVPDPLHPLEPVTGPNGPELKNEMILPAVFDPWAAHALYEAAHLVQSVPGSRLWLVSIGPRAKLQQVMMTIGQKVVLQLVALDGPAGGFVDAAATAEALADAIAAIDGLDRARLVLCGGWASASRDPRADHQNKHEHPRIVDQFQGVDELAVQPDGALRVVERADGGLNQVSLCAGPPVLLGWATGNRPEPPNNPQIGMQNMRGVMPALQKARPAQLGMDGLRYCCAQAPRRRRETRIVKDMPVDEIAREIVAWIRG